MVIAIILSHFFYGGFIHLIVSKTSEAISHYAYVYNYSNCGMIFHAELDQALRNAIAWTLAAFIYVVGYAALLYLSVHLLANN